MIHQRYLAKTLQASFASENICKNLTRTELSCESRKILPVSWKNIARKRLIYLTDISCKKMNKSKISCKNLPRSCISYTFQDFCSFRLFYKNEALFCKILQEISKNFASFVWQINLGIPSSFSKTLWLSVYVGFTFTKLLCKLSQKFSIYPFQRCYWVRIPHTFEVFNS